MTESLQPFLLASRDAAAPAPVLQGVQAQGRLDGVLFELTLRQTYRNTSERVLEVVYTFPLPHQAVLLGFASELNGARQVGTMVTRAQAEAQYEQALAEGDAPVMLEQLPGGLHTANVGNLKPGDELVLEVRFAQLLAFEQGRVRVAIPTTIAPRYGDASQGGLQPQQVPQASLSACYPLALSVQIGPSWAGAALDCATHRFTEAAAPSTPRTPGGEREWVLAPGAWLDRDVVLTLTPREPRPSLVVRAHDAQGEGAATVVLAAFQPPVLDTREHTPEPITLKLLVDCSGSMAGDSIASARAALRGVAAGLGEGDRLSLSRFGSTVMHELAPVVVSPRTLQQLQPLVDDLQADLGGTEMEAALRGVFGLPMKGAGSPADVLLITDGEVWQVDSMVAAARASGHRIFAIGVGSSPAEAVLRLLAESTGGACEFATPGEALEAAAQRMLRRMRQPRWQAPQVQWGATPVWELPLPRGVFGGDTVWALAGFATPVPHAGIHLTAEDARGQRQELARTEADAPAVGDTLPRLAAARRLAATGDEQGAELALRYQLLSAHTHCVLVHLRAEADKAGPAELHRVSSMLAAGWGGTGMVAGAAAAMAAPLMSSPMAPAPVGLVKKSFDMMERTRSAKPSGLQRRRGVKFQLADLDEAQASPAARNQTAAALAQPLVQAVVRHLSTGGSLAELPALAAGVSLPTELPAELMTHLMAAVDGVVAQGLSAGEAWLLLADWLNAAERGMHDAFAARVMRALLATIDDAAGALARSHFDQVLGAWATPAAGGEPDVTPPGRMARLRRALGGSA